MTVAVIADVHGNAWALDAVLADARERGAGTFLDLGDTLDGPLDPVGTADRLLALGALTVRGNHDRMMVERDPSTAHGLLRPEHRDWLAALPAIAEHEDLVLVHGAPHDDGTMLLETMDPAGTCERPLAEVEALLDGIDAPLILCGHSHTPRLVELPDGRRVLNPGSVGLQAYRDAGPPAWAIGTGSPHARYVLLHREDGRWRPEQRVVAYPWHEAVARAEAEERADWAGPLATGWP